MAAPRFGPLLKALRRKRGFTLRRFCDEIGLDPGNFSRVERGLFAPPGPEKIKQYAEALGLETGSDEYTELLDAASIDRGELPREFLTAEQLVGELPVLFRTLRGQKVSVEERDKLIELIRER